MPSFLLYQDAFKFGDLTERSGKTFYGVIIKMIPFSKVIIVIGELGIPVRS